VVGTTLAKAAERIEPEFQATPQARVFEEFRQWPLDRLGLTLALAAVPLSIAVSETLLVLSLVARFVYSRKTGQPVFLPWVSGVWLFFATLVLLSWIESPDWAAGWSEI